jgi:uroporphyrinogen decarboxylase
MKTAETTVAKLPFIEACFGRPHERVPVWMMRQAGRYLPEYREVRARHSFLDMCLKPEVAAEVTLQPVRRFGMDAAIIFSDILIFLPAMGLRVAFPEGGPRVEKPITSESDVHRLRPLDTQAAIPQVYDAIRLCISELDERTPLIGFCGAPFTLACYAIEGKGSKDWSHAKAFMYREPAAANHLLGKLAEAAAAHLNAQIDAGAHVVQIFDSWAGALNRNDFEMWCKPYLRQIVNAVRRPDVPVIVFARGVSPEWLDGIGADMYSMDWRTSLGDASHVLRPAGVQGNLDPAFLLASQETVVAETHRILHEMKGVNRFVFNLGHGVLPSTPVDAVQAVVDTVHEFAPGADQ